MFLSENMIQSFRLIFPLKSGISFKKSDTAQVFFHVSIQKRHKNILRKIVSNMCQRLEFRTDDPLSRQDVAMHDRARTDDGTVADRHAW